MKNIFYYIFILLILSACYQDRGNQAGSQDSVANVVLEKHRPHFHFSPDSMWMNDPNGMVYQDGTYHLFYQYYPDSTVWGPMHWGHATSSNMVTWEHQPIALYPDDLGYIFSGSAVVDKQNTSDFGTIENPPLVAIYTYHNPAAERKDDIQSQGIAYSIDHGDTWVKYDKNPVLKSPGIEDFRDPKVRWHEETEQWIMTLAVKDQISFYSSPDLKGWKLESEFERKIDGVNGVWECPDLFPLRLQDSDDIYWILIISINGGAPNSGSGTFYYVGQFDGKEFTPSSEKVQWIDYGPDNYAGVTWSNTGDRTLFIGWMSNWKYAQVVPTERWRSAMTIARELSLHQIDGELVASSMPVPEFDELDRKRLEIPEFEFEGEFDLGEEIDFRNETFELGLTLSAMENFEIILHNENRNQLVMAFDQEENQFKIDRSGTGDTSFHDGFANLIKVPRVEDGPELDLKLVVDVASIELFLDGGSSVSTVIFFPDEVLDQVSFRSEKTIEVKGLVIKDIL